MAGELAPLRDGIPVVTSSTQRDALFPSPSTNQRVQNLATGQFERYSGTGWVADVPSVHTPEQAGAKGDGVTNDTAAVQAAFDAAAASGGLVDLQGTYLHDGLTINGPNVVIRGRGWGTALIPSAASVHGITLGSTAHRTKILDLWFQGAATDNTTSSFGVFTNASAAPTDVEIAGCLFGALTTTGPSLNAGIKIDGGARWKVHDNTVAYPMGSISGCGYGVLCGATSELQAHDNHFLYATGHGRHAVYLSGGCTHCTVHHNTSIGGDEDAFPIFSQGAQPSNTDNLIAENTIIGGGSLTSGAGGISITGSAARNVVRGNVVRSRNDFGIVLVQFGLTCDANVIEDNDIRLTAWDGIAVYGASNTAVEENKIYDASQAAAGTFPSIGVRIDPTSLAPASGTIVQGNRHSPGTTSRSGLFLESGTLSTVMDGNHFPTGITGMIELNGCAVKSAIVNDFGLSAVSHDNGDADVTLQAALDELTELFATTLTANRTVTLSTTNAFDGATFRIVRTGLGAFTLNVGGLKTIPSGTAAFVDVAYNGTAWVLTGYGTL